MPPIVCPSADLELALRAIAFAAIGTAGQRCTTLRRLFVHESIHDEFVAKLKQVYAAVRIGDPLASDEVLVGPLIDAAAFQNMQRALDEARAHGARVHGGERVDEDRFPNAYYVGPALVEMSAQTGPVLRETVRLECCPPWRRHAPTAPAPPVPSVEFSPTASRSPDCRRPVPEPHSTTTQRRGN